MTSEYIITKDIFHHPNGVSIKNYGDAFDPWWGYDVIELTRGDVNALLDGKVLESSCAGEYGLLIRVNDEPINSD